MGLHVVVDRCGSGVGRHDVVVFRRGFYRSGLAGGRISTWLGSGPTCGSVSTW